jgi:hypothetical protein
MARRTFLERLADAALARASKTLKAATDALDVVTGEVPSEPSAKPQPRQPPSPTPSNPRRARSRANRLEELVEQLLEANRLQSETLERQQAQLERQQAEVDRLKAEQAQRQRSEDRQTRANERQLRAEERAEARLNTYPRRYYGRLGRLGWVPENLRLQGDYVLIEHKYRELLRAGVPETSLAVAAVSAERFNLYVAGS